MLILVSFFIQCKRWLIGFGFFVIPICRRKFCFHVFWIPNQELEKEVQLQISLRTETEMATRLLEKDVHEKQDVIIALRNQLSDVKGYNIEMHSKQQVSDTSFIFQQNELRWKTEFKDWGFPQNLNAVNCFLDHPIRLNRNVLMMLTLLSITSYLLSIVAFDCRLKFASYRWCLVCHFRIVYVLTMWLKIYIVNVCLQLLESKFKEKSNELKKLEEIVQAVKSDKDKMNNKWVRQESP